MDEFDDARLEDANLLRAADPLLKPLAEAGARLRREMANAEEPLSHLDDLSRPRAIIAYGPEARLIRATLEPTCPVPVVAWPGLGLPGWVGPLDLVVVLGSGGLDAEAAVHEAVRRGCRLLTSAPAESALARQSASRATTLLPTCTGDPLAAAIVVMQALHASGLGPIVNAESVADAMDEISESCSWHVDVSTNPAKMVALDLADTQSLVWGGSVLAARAARRIVEALRGAAGRLGLSADAAALVPLIQAAAPHDPFADPFDLPAVELRPGLVLVDDGFDDELAGEARARLVEEARQQDVRVARLGHDRGSPIERYASLLQQGRFAAAYLRIGLGRTPR